MPSIKYYDILEIPPDASAAMIHAAYRKLSRKYHPDTNPDAERVQHFKRIQKAREVLSDPAKRTKYDQHLERSGKTAGNLLNPGLHGMKYDNLTRGAGVYSVPVGEMCMESQCAGAEVERTTTSAWPIGNPRAATVIMIGIGLSCSLLAAALLVQEKKDAPVQGNGIDGSESHSLITNRPPGAVVRGNLAAWTEPAQPRFGEDYRVMLTVHLLTTDEPLAVNDLIDGHIAGRDGLRQEIPYHAGAPDASWIIADQGPERITSPDQIVSASAKTVQFSFEVPAVDRPTRESIQVRSNLLPSSEYWELVVNRAR